jgi:hypothetical protein
MNSEHPARARLLATVAQFGNLDFLQSVAFDDLAVDSVVRARYCTVTSNCCLRSLDFKAAVFGVGLATVF